MANVIIKDDLRREREARVARDFGQRHWNSAPAQAREYAECITARTNEVIEKLRKAER